MAIGKYGLSYKETKTLTLYEFNLYGLAYQIQKHEKRADASFLAWQNNQATATVKRGKEIVSAYNSFSEFYDNQKDFDNVMLGDNSTSNRRKMSVAEMNRLINAKRKEVENE